MYRMLAEELKKRLTNFYKDNSKHSNYQNIPEFVKNSIGYSEVINEEWRGDTARYAYIIHELERRNPKSICDIGANTGFFSLSLAYQYPNIKVMAFEGNQNHVEFMKLIKQTYTLDNIEIVNEYIDYDNIEILGNYDVMLNLNVLHHAGVDFDKDKAGFDSLDEYLVKYLKKLIVKSKNIIYQMGYNWGGDKSKPIVELQNDLGKLKYSHKIFERSGWEIQQISHITKNGTLRYKNYPDSFIDLQNKDYQKPEFLDYINALRLGTFSEFYRRPIFVLRSQAI
jgi:hypothetical protein